MADTSKTNQPPLVRLNFPPRPQPTVEDLRRYSRDLEDALASLVSDLNKLLTRRLPPEESE